MCFGQMDCFLLNTMVRKKLLDPYWVDEGELKDGESSPVLPPFIIVFCTGDDGEMPNIASRIPRVLRSLKKMRKVASASVYYTVLSLGDINYSEFCAAGKQIDLYLESAGATRIFPPGLADDGIDFSFIVDPWKKGMLEMLERTMKKGGPPPLAITSHLPFDPANQTEYSASGSAPDAADGTPDQPQPDVPAATLSSAFTAPVLKAAEEAVDIARDLSSLRSVALF